MTQIRDYLAPFTKPIREQKKQRIDEFIATEGPMYRPIMKYVETEVGLLDPDIEDDELDLKLYKAYHDLQVTLKTEGKELLSFDTADPSDFSGYALRYRDYFTKIGDVNKSDLARYVFDRRLVLQFLQKILGFKRTGSTAPRARYMS
jgi:hypothetical protein